MSSSASTIRFRRVAPADRDQLLDIAARTWEGHDYLPQVFDTWVSDRRAFFGALVQAGRVVGCGRVYPFDEKHGWLEGLRVHPDHQGHGLGREVARRVIAQAVSMGLRRLYFSTYFDNASSMRISEMLGFHRFTTCTNLDLRDLADDTQDAEASAAGGIESRSGMPDIAALMSNDWFFVPAEIRDRARYFPRPLTVRGCGAEMLLADNSKFPDHLEIAWMAAPDGRLPPPLIAAAVTEARRRGHRHVHVMLPEDYALEPFTAFGFRYFEQPHDVPLYTARAEQLRL
ncbi:MAG: GNAT family N-acetyltransferase [Candidatus Eisenbacteria bacterium]|nr:GNAT family N-acetyltransferase [Candidatus Eisenbacteria bacterium]